MKKILKKIKSKIVKNEDFDYPDEFGEDYLELEEFSRITEDKEKIVVRPYVLKDFEDIKPVIDSLREGNTIVLLDVTPLRDRDIIELKRAINKLKKTCEAINGDIAGLGENLVIATPSFAYVYRQQPQTEEKKETSEESF